MKSLYGKYENLYRTDKQKNCNYASTSAVAPKTLFSILRFVLKFTHVKQRKQKLMLHALHALRVNFCSKVINLLLTVH